MAKKSKSNKALKIGIPIAAVVLLIGISLAVLLGSSTRAAFLNVEEGTVEVDTGKGWSPATDGMKLSEDDSVRTLKGRAVLILHESIIVQLDENTEVSIEELSKEHVKVRQDAGSTWNKFADIIGIGGFEIETPTTVATVRGTEFWVDMESVGVSEGEVDVRMAGERFKVKTGHKVVMPADKAKLVRFTERDKQIAIAKKKVVVENLKKLREQEINKHKTLYNAVKKVKGWDDAEIQRRMDRLDRGGYDVESIKEKVKLPSKAIDKFTALSEEIIKTNNEIQEIKQVNTAESTGTEVIEQATLKQREPTRTGTIGIAGTGTEEDDGTLTRMGPIEIEGVEGEVKDDEHEIQQVQYVQPGVIRPSGSGSAGDK